MYEAPHAPVVYRCYASKFLDKVRRYWSKPKLDGKCTSAMVLGETTDISRFRFRWFEPIWYYNQYVSFPHDKMEPGFFLDMAENTGDNFSYVILPVESYSDIPLEKRPVTLVCSVVRSRSIGAVTYPLDSTKIVNFKCMNELGDELIGDDEDLFHKTMTYPLSPTNMNSEEALLLLDKHIDQPTLATFGPTLSTPVEQVATLENTPLSSSVPTLVPVSTSFDFPERTGDTLFSDHPNIISQSQEYLDDAAIGNKNEDVSAEPFSVQHDTLTA